jgi:Dyp-type peroxidase family
VLITGIIVGYREASVAGQAIGVLPDDISRDSHAESWLIFIDFAAGTDVQAWLRDTATTAVQQLMAPVAEGEAPVAVCTVGFGPGLFDKAGHPEQRPPGLTVGLPSVVPAENHDLVFYVFSLSDAVVADFLRTVARGPQVAKASIERGYQRASNREVFGQRDGLRNVIPKADRAKVAFIGEDEPEVPAWASGGSYMAYLKIKQDVAAWQQLSVDERAAVIGRRDDGSRLDLAAGTAPEDEGAIVTGAASPPVASHVRKAGPRGNPNEDAVRIFRRGTPYIECDASGALSEGLQFVSYQASVDDFLTILQRWMLNPNFPVNGAQLDALFATNLASFIKGGLYFAVPDDERFIGAGLFDPAGDNTGVLQIRLTVTDQSNQPDPMASLEGAVFTVAGPSGDQLTTTTTNAAGRAVVEPLPVGVLLTVTETAPPPGASLPTPASQPVTLEHCKPGLLRFLNQRSGTPGGYGA